MKKRVFALISLVSLPLWAMDSADEKRLSAIQQQWAYIQYELPEEKRVDAFEKLAAQTSAFVKDRPNAAQAWIMSGMVISSWAGAQGAGPNALGKVKQAKADLEKAIALDPDALQGAAYISLASLYEHVPGWPIAFGDKDKAKQLLEQALKVNPNGIDPLYFMAEHEFGEGNYAQARDALNKAALAPPRPGYEKADAGRRKDIQLLLAKVNKKLD